MFDKIITENGIKFNELEEKIYKFVCIVGCMLIKYILESKDKKIMKSRDKRVYRHKGYKQACIKTVMGEVEYKRAVYKMKTETEDKYVYILDEEMNIEKIGDISSNLAEKSLETIVNTTSYRKAAEEISEKTNQRISHEALRTLVIKAGEKIEKREKEEIKLKKENKLVSDKKEVSVLFEEADGLWINLQGKDREKQKEKNVRKNKKNKKVKTELKLYVAYEGWKKDSQRHEVINKTYIAGMINSKELKKLRDTKIYKRYDEEKIEVRVLNGDGARWIKNMATKETIYQKDKFHIDQEIIRDISEEKNRKELKKIIDTKRYEEVLPYIENLKYESGGEERIVNKLDKLKSYLSTGLERYQDILKKQKKEMPKEKEGIEYRNLGIMEGLIFSILKVRLSSGRKSWSKKGASYLAKICAHKAENSGKIKFEKLEDTIEIDNSIEEYIKEIEENVKRNKKRAKIKEVYENTKGTIVKTEEILRIIQNKEITRLMYR